MYLQTCTLVPFTICWYQVRQDPFLIPAKERQRLHTSQQKDTVANIPPQAPKDKQGTNCKVTAHASTVHLLFVKKKANYPKNYNTNAMKPTVQKASLCCTFMDREECVCEISFSIWLCFGDDKQGLSISQPLPMQIYLSAPLYQLHKLLKQQHCISKTKQTDKHPTQNKNPTHRTEKPHNYNDLNLVLTW